MDIYIHKDVLGFQKHLLCQSGTISKVETIPNEATLVYGDPSFFEIAKLYGVTPPTFPSKPHIKALQGVLGTRDVSEVPWQHALPRGAFKQAVEGLFEEIHNSFSTLDLRYYLEHYKGTLPLLGEMKRAKIDLRSWFIHSTNRNLIAPHVLKTFQPDEDWFAPDVHYSKCDTKTGRLKVVDGANILHLPKEQRNIFTSRFGREGKVIQLDFSALEPRVVLFLNQLFPPPSPGNVPQLPKSLSEGDVYLNVLKHMGINNIKRESVKDVILNQLYGAGYESILEKIQRIPDPNGFIEAVEDFFGLNHIRNKLLEEYEANNRLFILSHYGRKLDTSEAKPYMLLNYYIQSTAVDIALYGFQRIMKLIKDNIKIIPLFLLHDAFILDVHNSQEHLIPQLCEEGSTNIALFPNCRFLIKASRF